MTNTRVSRKYRKRKRVATSLQVFLSFVKRTGQGKVDVGNVFSPKCFKLWLKTRTGLLKHPEQAFHRTLVAHVRGHDTRQPFPAAVEKELLKFLRHDRRIWTRCFPSSKMHIGKQRFKHKGYHEGHDVCESFSRKALDMPLMSFETLDEDEDFKGCMLPCSEGSELQVKKRLNLENKGTGCDKVFEGHAQHEGNAKVAKVACCDSMEAHAIIIPQSQVEVSPQLKKVSSPLSTSGETTIPTAEYDQSRFTLETPWDKLVQAMGKSSIETVLDEVAAEARNYGNSFLPMAVKYFLKKTPDPGDIRYDMKTWLPEESQCFFAADKPVVELLVDPSWRVLSSSSNYAEVFRSTSPVESLFQINASWLQYWLLMSEYLPRQYKNRGMWKRELYQRGDGSVGLFLVKHEILENELLTCTIQDISESFPECLKVVYFM